MLFCGCTVLPVPAARSVPVPPSPARAYSNYRVPHAFNALPATFTDSDHAAASTAAADSAAGLLLYAYAVPTYYRYRPPNAHHLTRTVPAVHLVLLLTVPPATFSRFQAPIDRGIAVTDSPCFTFPVVPGFSRGFASDVVLPAVCWIHGMSNLLSHSVHTTSITCAFRGMNKQTRKTTCHNVSVHGQAIHLVGGMATWCNTVFLGYHNISSCLPVW